MLSDIHINITGWIGYLYIYLHYPGQLMNEREGDEKVQLNLQTPDLIESIYKIGIAQLQVLRKRHDAKITCNQDLESNLDMRWRESAMTALGCIPTYWKNLPHSETFRSHMLRDCMKLDQYKSFKELLDWRELANISYEESCISPKIISNLHSADNSSRGDLLYIHIKHESDFYAEVKNVKECTFDDLWSQIGGLVGIFLGCSLVQLPDLLFTLFSFSKNILKTIFNC